MLFGVAPLAMIIPRFWDFSRGEIRYVWISPGEKCAPVALLLGRKSQVLHFSWEKNSHMFDLSPGEINFRHLWISPRGKSDICRLFPGGILDMLHFSPGEICTCRISPGETFQPVTFPPGRNSFFCLMYHQDTPTSKYVPCVRGTIQVIWSKSFIDK